MPHLNGEELARLVDEPALPHEAAHLRDCLVCRRELEELRQQTLTLAGLADPAPGAAAWHRLEAALRAEGLLRGAAPVSAATPWWSRPATLRAAAAIALFLLGGAAGAALWNRPAGRVAAAPVLRPATAVRPEAPAPTLLTDVPVAPTGGSTADAAGAAAGVRLTADETPRARSPRQQELRRAARDLAQAEGAYLAALQHYAAVADPASGADPQTRLDALERMISTTRDALERAPDDPLINGYHLAAVRERDALQRQLATADTDWF